MQRHFHLDCVKLVKQPKDTAWIPCPSAPKAIDGNLDIVLHCFYGYRPSGPTHVPSRLLMTVALRFAAKRSFPHGSAATGTAARVSALPSLETRQARALRMRTRRMRRTTAT
jgi:hypothetical protein